MDENTLNTLQILKDIVSDVSDWLKFAEAKNAAFIVADITIAAIMADSMNEINMKSSVIFILMIIIGGPCLISQIPFLSQNKRIVKEAYRYYSKKGIKGNHVFYLSIFLDENANPKDFKRKYYKDLKIDVYNHNCFIDDYYNQIISLSKVASIKYYLFEISVKLTLVVMIMGMVMLIIA